MRRNGYVQKCRRIISIHAPHEGVRLILIQIINITASISIHAPHEGVRLDVILSDFLGKNFNPRTPRGGATESLEETHEETAISIHAPHEGVRRINLSSPSRNGISIHAPHEGVRRLRRACSPARQIFQSTHPTRGCDRYVQGRFKAKAISIHAPHEGVRRLSRRKK